jgi:hypothetical protein
MATEAREMKSLSLDEMRAILSDEIHRIRAGETTPANVNAVNNAVGQILRSVKLQMDYYRQTGKTPDIALLSAGTTAKD